jgi:hypothetical protein
MMLVRVLAAVLGGSIVGAVVMSAVRTVVVPRGEPVLLTRLVFVGVRKLFAPMVHPRWSYERRDRVMARFAPTALMLLPLAWASGVVVGFTLIYWATVQRGIDEALLLSGSSLTTLGFERADDATMHLTVIEALLGLALVALLISFLPTIYGHFSRREATVAKLYSRAEDRDGVAHPATFLIRSHLVGGLGQLDEMWHDCEQWFVELGESHTSFASLVYFRSPSPERSWITASGVLLDAAALTLSTVDGERSPRASFMIRAGFLSLRDIARFFSIPFDDDPSADDPISITREEFDEVYERLKQAGVPVRADQDQAWRDFVGWRVNYDTVLIRLAALVMAPAQPWVSDRSVVGWTPRVRDARHRRSP